MGNVTLLRALALDLDILHVKLTERDKLTKQGGRLGRGQLKLNGDLGGKTLLVVVHQIADGVEDGRVFGELLGVDASRSLFALFGKLVKHSLRLFVHFVGEVRANHVRKKFLIGHGVSLSGFLVLSLTLNFRRFCIPLTSIILPHD
nr:MAG TPA: hypothetical protein [Caudoviricetes sp.]